MLTAIGFVLAVATAHVPSARAETVALDATITDKHIAAAAAATGVRCKAKPVQAGFGARANGAEITLDNCQTGGAAVTAAAPGSPATAAAGQTAGRRTVSGASPFANATGATLVNHGGAVVSTGQAINIYANCAESCWGSPSSFLTNLFAGNFIHVTDQYISSIANNRYAFGGAINLTSSFAPTMTDSNAQAAVIAAIHTANPGGGGGGYNKIYNLFLPQGQSICYDSAKTQCYSPSNYATFYFCAYHSSFSSYDAAGKLIHVLYTVEPYQNISGCQVSNYTPPNGTLADSTYSTLSHEIFETITDPDINAWYVDAGTYAGDEIGDLCAGSDNIIPMNGTSYLVQSEYDNYTQACVVVPTLTAAAITNPTPGSVLTSTSATFLWSTPAAYLQFALSIGTTGAGSYDIYNSYVGTGNSQTVANLPSSGIPVYVRLWTQTSTNWYYIDYTYTSVNTTTNAVLTAPSSGSTLSGAALNLAWSAGNGASSYALHIGSTGVGSYDIYAASMATALSATVTVPANGQTLYVRLWSQFQGVWRSNDYTFTEQIAGAKAALTSPPQSSALKGSSATLTWSAGTGVLQYALHVGSTGVGSYDLLAAPEGTNLSAALTGLPTSGGTIYVRLWTQFSSGWQFNDYTLTAANFLPAKATMISPTAGSTFAGSSATFTWSAGTSVSQYALHIGSTGYGSYDVLAASEGTNTSATISNLPTAGGLIYVRLWSQTSTGWQYADYAYTAATAGSTVAAMTSPVPGSTIPAATATLMWSAGTGVTQYALHIGTTGAGSYNVLAASEGTSLSASVTALPAASTIYVRLWYQAPAGWGYKDYTYSRP